ncbi:ATP-binding protein [Pedobacter sp. KBS0701]|uniref:AAA family ATPase n=1 Tax=Pedobacter sp. KBS0701 TaxID=2578106 RepID=UPI00110D37A4|nr:AAA family ATPase [Pedobacter sp. KBS0701]QDW24690.1 ATP-binding protein [Pedobacter sp. KBS0701]
MEAIIFCGIQATRKTTFFKERFFKTHVHISLDLLNTRNKEIRFIETCILTSQPFVVDNTNPTLEERAKYISIAKANKFKVTGYYFQSKLTDAVERNNQRSGKEKIPEIGIRGTFKKLNLPSINEGFDELYYVTAENNSFIIKPWSDEI